MRGPYRTRIRIEELEDEDELGPVMLPPDLAEKSEEPLGRAIPAALLVGMGAMLIGGLLSAGYDQRCEHPVLAEIPPSTVFRYDVAHRVRNSNLTFPDRIEVFEMKGSRPNLEVGGVYLVSGRYSLERAERAELHFGVTPRRVGTCLVGGAHATQTVFRGSGTFLLASPVPFEGYPRISFFVEGVDAGGLILAPSAE